MPVRLQTQHQHLPDIRLIVDDEKIQRRWERSFTGHNFHDKHCRSHHNGDEKDVLYSGVAVFVGKPRYNGFGGTFFRWLIGTRKSSSGS